MSTQYTQTDPLDVMECRVISTGADSITLEYPHNQSHGCAMLALQPGHMVALMVLDRVGGDSDV